MKKLSLTLLSLLALSGTIYFVSCEKQAAPLLLPAIQRIREVPKAAWKVSADKSLLEQNMAFSQKLKTEYAAYETDSMVMVTVRVKFEGQQEEHLLPYVVKSLNGSKHYFYSLAGGKPRILFHNTEICDFSADGTATATPLESVSFTFQKIE